MGTDRENEGSTSNKQVNRRSVLTAGVVAAATAGVAPSTTSAQPTRPGANLVAAGLYEGATYNNSFNTAYDSNHIAGVQADIRRWYPDKTKLFWGDYQRKVVPRWQDWGSQAAFNDWPIHAQQARDNLEKQLATFSDPKNAMDPFNLNNVASNLMEHLDGAIRIALWDKAIPVVVKVDHNYTKRHHGFETVWNPTPGPGVTPTSLTLHMTCPVSGWQGWATWRNKHSSKHITKMTASWIVPQEPAKDGQIVFIFNGLESLAGKKKPGAILQPVLQWTNDGWYVRSWYVNSSFDPEKYPDLPKLTDRQDDVTVEGRAYSVAVQVRPGQTIKGVIEGTNFANGNGDYQCWIEVDGNRKKDADLPRTGIPELVWAVCAIESYKVRNSALDYPNPVSINSINLQIDGSALSSINWQKNKVGDFKTNPSKTGLDITFML